MAHSLPNGDAAGVVTNDEIAVVARAYLVDRPPLAREDCTGLVAAITADAGRKVDGSVRDLWSKAQAEGRLQRDASVGDVVFFDDTWDKDGDGKHDDPLTHVAVITGIESDGTIVMVHRGTSSGIAELRMNLDHRDEHSANGEIVNSYLAMPGWGDERLAGELFHGFATFADDGTRGTNATIASSAATRRGPRVRPGAADRPPAAPPTVASPPDPGMTGLDRIIEGRRLKWRDVNAVYCSDVPALRDAVYARHGFVFHDASRNALFVGQSWYAPDPTLTSADAGHALTAQDRFNLDLLDGVAGYCRM